MQSYSFILGPSYSYIRSNTFTVTIFVNFGADNSVQNELSRCQCDPHKIWPKTTGSKGQNSVQDKSAQCKIQEKTTQGLSKEEGIPAMLLLGRCTPSLWPKNRVSLFSSWYCTTTFETDKLIEAYMCMFRQTNRQIESCFMASGEL